MRRERVQTKLVLNKQTKKTTFRNPLFYKQHNNNKTKFLQYYNMIEEAKKPPITF